MRFAPPTSAQRVGLVSDRIVSQARCKAAMELEHAVSQVTDGPRRLLSGVSSVCGIAVAAALLTRTS